MTPAEIAHRMTDNILFSRELSMWSEAQRDEYLKQFEIPARAMELTPKGIDVASSRIADAAAAAAAATLEFNDVDLNRLTIEKALMDQVLLLEQARLLPSLDQKAAESLKTDVLHTVDSANAIIRKHLGDILPGQKIDEMTRRLRDDLIPMIQDPTTYWMKQRPDPDGLQRLLQVFEERLALSRDRAVTRLHLVDASRDAANASGDEPSRAARRDREMQDIIDEVLSPLRKGLLTTTSPPQLLELNQNPDRIVPGYSATVRQWSERYRVVAGQVRELAAQEREHERRAREAHSVVTRMARAALADVIEGGAVSPNGVVPKEVAGIDKETQEQRYPLTEPSREVEGMNLRAAMGCGVIAIVIAFLCLCYRHFRAKNHRIRHSPGELRDTSGS
jgi:hypothetical protein